MLTARVTRPTLAALSANPTSSCLACRRNISRWALTGATSRVVATMAEASATR